MSVPFGFGLPNDPGDGQPGSGQPGNGSFDMASLGAMLQQFGQLLQQGGAAPSGPVDWGTVRDVARKALAATGDPSILDGQTQAVRDAVALADLWLNEATTLPSIGGTPLAWSRSEWVESTLPMWQLYVQPIAEQLQQAMPDALPADLGALTSDDLRAMLPEPMRAMLPETLPPEFTSMLGPMLGMMRQLGVMSFSMQLGQALAALASEVVGLGDIGIPLAKAPTCALLPRNVEAFGAGIGIPLDDVRLYLALRESAHQRLFAHVPWLRARMVGAMEEYARGIRVDQGRLEQAVEGIDVSSPQALQEVLASGLLQPQDTEEQRAALARLETLLALIEGWVDDVVTAAAGSRLPSAAALQETVRRRRAGGGPAERTFATLIGLELRPKSLREAATLFAAVRSAGGIEERDALWGHPDLLPDADDLRDPLAFIERTSRDASTLMPPLVDPPAADDAG